MWFWKNKPKHNLNSAADAQFFKSLPIVIDFLKHIECPNPKLSANDLWLLKSYQLAVILRCLSIDKEYMNEFDALFKHSMSHFVPYHESIESISSALDFFAKDDDAIRQSEFILDVIGLDLPDSLLYIKAFWGQKNELVPCISIKPFVMSLYWDLFCSAGDVIEQGLGISKYKCKFEQMLKNRSEDYSMLKKAISVVPSSAPDIFRRLRPVYLGETTDSNDQSQT